ncbi:polysaccharide deacetylase family protein [Metasolibacillus meyeri]|uniref:Polysaccharide deacetylase family protein n=1 Tax=Metasolibacillus meyeri TaxID=1071052 RepID=A0AAW9NUQ3_9BACL|nr:polysaccharide deacetylase family protein [Metasolibacillus meyeri]MEC1178593.1 polysaccharide deacetylase family protein [Metasolibacillus meyeri]
MKNERKKRRGPWIDLLLIGAIIVLAAAVIFFTIINPESKFQQVDEPEQTESNTVQGEITESQSSFPGIRIVTDISNDKIMPYAIQYPQSTSDSFNEAVTNFITASKEHYIAEMRLEKNVDSNEIEPGELNIIFETYPYKEHYYSFVLKKKLRTNSSEKTTATTYFYNNETGELLDIRAILGEDLKNLEVLSTHIRSQITDSVEFEGHLLEEEMLAKTEPKWKLFQRFSIQNEALVLYFDSGEIASPDLGISTVTTSLSYINPILAEQFQEQMVGTETIVSGQDTSNNGAEQDHIKRVALTFDDGPDPKVTRHVLQLLEQYNAKATFFMLGSRVQYYPEIVQEVYDAGHEVGNHTWSHPVLTKLTSKQVLSEYNSTEQAIQQAIGQSATVFRPPYGATNQRVNGLIPIPVVNWTIDTLDWKHRDAKQLLPIIKNHMHNNAIILMHDIHVSTAEGLEDVLQYLSEEGYTFVTVSEILKYR